MGLARKVWIPAFAGMTGVGLRGSDVGFRRDDAYLNDVCFRGNDV